MVSTVVRRGVEDAHVVQPCTVLVQSQGSRALLQYCTNRPGCDRFMTLRAGAPREKNTNKILRK